MQCLVYSPGVIKGLGFLCLLRRTEWWHFTAFFGTWHLEMFVYPLAEPSCLVCDNYTMHSEDLFQTFKTTVVVLADNLV